jgi:hypothetical protein
MTMPAFMSQPKRDAITHLRGGACSYDESLLSRGCAEL